MIARHRRSDVSAFAGVDLFDGYAARQLASLAPHADRLVVAAGARLARAGRRPHEVVVILAGEAVVRRAGVEVGRLRAGAVVGAAEELDGTPHDADVVAGTAVRTLVVTGQAFRWAARSLPGFATRLAAAREASRPAAETPPIAGAVPADDRVTAGADA